jgi:hypothetical protein
MKRLLVAGVISGLFVVGASSGLAASNPNGTGQPSQTCLSSTAPTEPGQAANAPGSAFNENGGTAGGVYAGTQPQNSNNPNSVSQYDVACYQVSQH